MQITTGSVRRGRVRCRVYLRRRNSTFTVMAVLILLRRVRQCPTRDRCRSKGWTLATPTWVSRLSWSVSWTKRAADRKNSTSSFTGFLNAFLLAAPSSRFFSVAALGQLPNSRFVTCSDGSEASNSSSSASGALNDREGAVLHGPGDLHRHRSSSEVVLRHRRDLHGHPSKRLSEPLHHRHHAFLDEDRIESLDQWSSRHDASFAETVTDCDVSHSIGFGTFFSGTMHLPGHSGPPLELHFFFSSYSGTRCACQVEESYRRLPAATATSASMALPLVLDDETFPPWPVDPVKTTPINKMIHWTWSI